MKYLLPLIICLLVPGIVYAANFDSASKDKLIEELMKDDEFKTQFLKRMLMEQADPESQAIAGMLPENKAQNMLPESKEVTKPKASENKIKEGGTSGMVDDNPLVAPPQPGTTLSQDTAEPVKGIGVVIIDENGSARIRPKSELLKRKIEPAKGSAKNVDLFMSLSCPWCIKLWNGLQSEEATKNHLLEDHVNLWILPKSDAEAAIAMVFEWILAQDPEAAMEFLNSYFNKSFGENINDDLFISVNNWLRDRNLRQLDDFRINKKAVDAIGRRIEEGINRAQKLGVTGYPSVYADDKEDRAYFGRIADINKK